MRRKHNQCLTKATYVKGSKIFVKKSFLPVQEHAPCTEEITPVPKSNRFECKICGQDFKYKQSLQRHQLRKHTMDNGIICDISDDDDF